MKKSLFSVLLLAGLAACNSSHQKLSQEEYNALTDEQKRSVEYALEGIDLLDKDLELSLFASEPMLRNPTNMDIDDKGRVWVCEGFNYRNELNPRNPYDEKGDRILILEDTDGDGKADKSKVFYQGEDINSALGIGVFGNKVIVSRSPHVFVFTDEDGDDVPDKKEILFEGIGGEQHDHGMHAFTFGPDGKFYFNYGNAGEGLLTKGGKPLYDSKGRKIAAEGKPYREGMVYRSDLDGSNVEILAWNFRNNYEVTVDSYGRMWQSDNDDDGNRGTRINYVMDYGNYGFKDEMTGADWRTRRVNMSDSIPLAHWHLNDPGVVPNLLQTMAGSPTGITMYEGDMLPAKYKGQMLHTDAGPNVMRAYPVKKSGAGFTAEISGILDGNKRDNWFRPSDVTVAPDGSVFVSDWYDPGVGGHAMGDVAQGRIYRVTSKGHKGYEVKTPDYSSLEGALEALKSPNTATRYKGWVSLHEMGPEAEEALVALYSGSDELMKARAFWLLTKLDGKGREYIEKAAEDKSEDIRVAAIRAARELKNEDLSFLYNTLSQDQSAQVRREVALAIRFKDAPETWLNLAKAYDGQDRWYLEALGIAAEDQWDIYLPSYLEQMGENWDDEKAARDIVWRSRSSMTMDLLGRLIAEEKGENKLRYFRAMDFQSNGDKNSVLLSLLGNTSDVSEKVVIFKQLDINDLSEYPKLEEELSSILAEVSDTDFLDLVSKYSISSEKDRLLMLVRKSEEGRDIQQGARMFINLYGIGEVKKLMNDENQDNALNAIERFGLVDETPVTNLLISIFNDKNKAIAEREMAMEAMNGWRSEEILWDMIQKNKVSEEVMPIAKRHMLATWHNDIRAKANDFFDDGSEEEIDVKTLLAKTGKPSEGQKVFDMYCKTCHMVNGNGVDFGPGLSQIGAKLSKDGLYNAILNPSEGMGFGYETQQIIMNDGTEIQAIITSKTENEVNVKLLGQSDQTRYPLSDVKSIKQLNTSLMPKFPLEEQQMVNLVEYLSGLK
ncbi:PVC-type heme-binding CxxCH protein [Jiulongibacter sediminis]|uniref:Heme transporter CcmD n=1 Tax=Jiulongibacter sediminis TaxID=1605367 RepID=A0A0P7BRN4_9BACT|nr:PVC-type heme-binding CxxCH protein [Jiulongibacter sediminis]KPM49989.1 heme transporter CcmD [Jiulongibacter sediminis]TBX27020.1 heme transporter CcmD [Jiulongibacter sediminis]